MFYKCIKRFPLRVKSFLGGFQASGRENSLYFINFAASISFRAREVNFPGDAKLYVTESCNFTVIEDGASEVPGRYEPNWPECGAIIGVKFEICELYIVVGHVSRNHRVHKTNIRTVLGALDLLKNVSWASVCASFIFKK